MFDIEKWLPFLLAKGHQITFNLMKPAVEEFGLTPPQFATLSFLWKHDGINQQELGILMCVDRTTIGGIVERLERLGYVRREGDYEDRRSYVLFVTEKGLSIQPKVLEALKNVKRCMDSRLSQDEQEQLIILLKKLRQSQMGRL